MSSLCKVDSIQYDPESPISIPTVPIPEEIVLNRKPSGRFSESLFGVIRGKVPFHGVPFHTSISVSDVGTFPLLSRRNGSGVPRELQSVALRINAYKPTHTGDSIIPSGMITLFRNDGGRYSEARYEASYLLGDFEVTVTGATFHSGTKKGCSVSGFKGKEWEGIKVKLVAGISVAESDVINYMRDEHGIADSRSWPSIRIANAGNSDAYQISAEVHVQCSSGFDFALNDDCQTGLEGFDNEPQLIGMVESLVG